MNPNDSRLVRLVLDSPALVSQVVELLESGDLDLEVTRPQLAYRVVAPDTKVDAVRTLMASWPLQGEAGTRSFAATLRTALEVRTETLRRAPSCEVVWTGTGATGGVRSTTPVILEMLAVTRRTVMLLSYSVWLRQAKVNGVLQRLAGLSSAGIDVVWIFDAGYRDGHNFTELTTHWPSVHRRPRVYSWRDLDDEIAKLHAKVLIVDDDDALVTSANLTGHGLTSNLEIGVRVRGHPARELASHLRHLIASEAFETYEWT